jgi:hypothetical protein
MNTSSISSAWLHKGHLEFHGQDPRRTTTISIRESLCASLGLPVPPSQKSLKMAAFPSGMSFKHTYWWRETDLQYGEGQFVASISKLHAVLSLGVSIEKGVSKDTAARPEQIMDRALWDWQRLLDSLATILSADVPGVAASIERPVHVRIRSRDRLIAGTRAWQMRAFSFVEDQYFERHTARVKSEPEILAEHVRDLDRQADTWVIVQFACDLSAAEADGKSPSEVADILMHFDRIRRRLRP